MNKKTVALLNKLLKESGLKKNQIAEHTEVSEQAVGKWFRTGNISKAKLPLLATLLNTTATEIITGERAHHDSNQITPIEQELIQKYRKLNTKEKQLINELIEEKNELRHIKEELSTYKTDK